MSFPSGHSSCSMVVGLFGALYILWAVHWRGGKDMLSPAATAKGSNGSSSGGWSFGAYCCQELTRLGLTLLVLALLAWPWGVAVSRCEGGGGCCSNPACSGNALPMPTNACSPTPPLSVQACHQ